MLLIPHSNGFQNVNNTKLHNEYASGMHCNKHIEFLANNSFDTYWVLNISNNIENLLKKANKHEFGDEWNDKKRSKGSCEIWVLDHVTNSTQKILMVFYIVMHFVYWCACGGDGKCVINSCQGKKLKKSTTWFWELDNINMPTSTYPKPFNLNEIEKMYWKLQV